MDDREQEQREINLLGHRDKFLNFPVFDFFPSQLES